MMDYSVMWMKLLAYIGECCDKSEADNSKDKEAIYNAIIKRMSKIYTDESHAASNRDIESGEHTFNYYLVCSNNLCLLMSDAMIVYPLFGITDDNIDYVDFDKTIDTIYRAFNMNKPKHIDIKLEGDTLQ